MIEENREICHCKHVTVLDIEKALHESETFSEVEKSFKEVQNITHCSTGCGGCYEKVLDVISELISK